jgi:hypothetical protein
MGFYRNKINTDVVHAEARHAHDNKHIAMNVTSLNTECNLQNFFVCSQINGGIAHDRP